ncbi:MAG: IS200/IS605 family transposase [Bacteroidia bacterium]
MLYENIAYRLPSFRYRHIYATFHPQIMAQSHCKLYIQIFLAVRHRNALIDRHRKQLLHDFVAQVLAAHSHRLLAINAMPDHVHILISYDPGQLLADLVAEVQYRSAAFLVEQQLSASHFAWQETYGAFSYSRSQVPSVIGHIENQETHHRRFTFREEYLAMLRSFKVKYEPQELFEFFR